MMGNYWTISHHFCAVCILVRCPAGSISWVRQLEGCSPFITISISLSSKSTHFDRFSKINLQPIVIPGGFFGTPAIAPVTIESTIRRLITSAMLRGSCHLIVCNFALVGNSYRLGIAVICYSWNSIIELALFKIVESWLICLSFKTAILEAFNQSIFHFLINFHNLLIINVGKMKKRDVSQEEGFLGIKLKVSNFLRLRYDESIHSWYKCLNRNDTGPLKKKHFITLASLQSVSTKSRTLIGQKNSRMVYFYPVD